MKIADAVAALGSGPLTEESLRSHIFPLFSKTLASKTLASKTLAKPGIYLANHSLGRPLDQTEDDLREGFSHWQNKLDDAWDPWLEEEHAHRSRIAQLINAPRPDCIVPKTSAGQGLRTVLNALPGTPRVLTTAAEFDSVDIILKQYAAAGKITLHTAPHQSPDGKIDLTQLVHKIREGIDLVVISQVLFTTSQIIPDLDHVAAACHNAGARLLVDSYHAIGVFPVDVAAMQADFLIGGSYKYLRGGPGASFLYISPDALTSDLKPIDIGWFAKDHPFNYERPNPPRFAPGGDAYLESTPPVLTYYQARAGQLITLQLGVTRIRAYNLDRLILLKQYLADLNIPTKGADEEHGGFLTIESPHAVSLAKQLAHKNITTDARHKFLRLCPDYLTPDTHLREVASTLSALMTGLA